MREADLGYHPNAREFLSKPASGSKRVAALRRSRLVEEGVVAP